MLNIKKGVPIPKKTETLSDAETRRRATEIQEILMVLEVGDCVEIEIKNANAWYVSFLNAKDKLGQKDKEFTRRKGDAKGVQTNTKLYTIWRTK